MTEPSVRQVLCVAPSAGLGGGIERLVGTAVEYLRGEGAAVDRVDLLTPGVRIGPLVKIRFVGRLYRAARRQGEPFVVLVMHPALAWVAWWATHGRLRRHLVVNFFGTDAWGPRPFGLRRVARRPRVRIVTISGYTAGALLRTAPAKVLAPGIGRHWYEQLVAARHHLVARTDAELNVLTTFRLDAWVEKGLVEVIGALDDLRGARPLQLHVAGSGRVEPALEALLARHPWVTLHRDLADADLARLYARADVFVLATRTRPGRAAQGEGFGIVLVEAQLAGTPVVAPAFGGSVDAFVPGVTGLSPVDESVGALRSVLRQLLEDASLRREMGAAAAAWAQARFAPDLHAAQHVQILLEG